MVTNQQRYVGRLASPIIRKSALTFEGEVSESRVAAFWKDHSQHQHDTDQQRQEAEKIALLMQHFEIAGNDLGALALALARRHVPGFTIVPEKRPGGRKRVWDGPKLQNLLKSVEEAKQQNVVRIATPSSSSPPKRRNRSIGTFQISTKAHKRSGSKH